MDSTSIGQPAAPLKADENRATQATTEGVDAQNANEFDSRHRLGPEKNKPLTDGADVADENKHQAVSSQPADDPNRRDPDERTDLLALQGRDGSHALAKGYRQSSVDTTVDKDLERERLQPGLNAEGHGGVGADPAGHHEDSNSNT